jgi:glyoxylase-like metal-dependent hydrolase (beta-lactamase superfamily II)
MQFLTEPPPPYGVRLDVLPGIARVVAPNPGPMTYHGTNTWLIDTEAGVTVLDPGPDDAAHVRAVLAAGGGRMSRILLSHTHPDHVGALAAFQAATGAPAYGFGLGRSLSDGDVIDGMTVLHTPGHAADHLCFARADGVVFTADHVMSWSTSVVSPPEGDMAAYVANLRRLLVREDRLYLPGHGPPLEQPRPFVQGLLEHRRERETAILTRLPGTVDEIVEAVYAPVDPRLRPAAARNVLAHLLKLRGEERAEERGGMWRAIPGATGVP